MKNKKKLKNPKKRIKIVKQERERNLLRLGSNGCGGSDCVAEGFVAAAASGEEEGGGGRVGCCSSAIGVRFELRRNVTKASMSP